MRRKPKFTEEDIREAFENCYSERHRHKMEADGTLEYIWTAFCQGFVEGYTHGASPVED